MKLNTFDDFLFERELDEFFESLILIAEQEVTWNPKTGETRIVDKDNNEITWTYDQAKSANEKKIADSLIKFLNKIKGNSKKVQAFLGRAISTISKYFEFPRNMITFLLAAAILTGSVEPNQLRTQKEAMEYFAEMEEAVKLAEQKKLEAEQQRKEEILKLKAKKPSLNTFLKDIAFKESSGNWKSINRLGYIGLYQFGGLALKEVGLDGKVSAEEFRKNPGIFPPEMQTEKMKELMAKNWHYMRKYHDRVGDTINDIPVTQSGMIAAAHLVGAKSVRQYLKSNGKVNRADANGVKVSDYMSKFKDYDMSEIIK